MGELLMAKSKGPGWEVVESASKMVRNIQLLDFMKENEVYVGIPQKESKREDEQITNAELLFIHTNGSPINNVPPRPVIEPAIKHDSERLSGMMKKAAQLVLAGKIDDAIIQLKRTGMRGQNVSRNWFVNPENNWPPNSPSVIAEKRRKGSTNPRPLIDTGELRKSITYFVKTKGGRSK